MRIPLLVLSVVVAPVLVVAACGGGQPAPVAPPVASTTPPTATPTPEVPATTSATTTAATTASASASVVEAPTVWSDDLTKEQKVAMMKQRVVPAMKPIFQEADAKAYADFGCKTCHGPDFKDPDDFLPKLHMKKDKLVEFETKPKVAKFMAEKVAPAMASALGLPHYDPATKKGFGCGGCHPIEAK